MMTDRAVDHLPGMLGVLEREGFGGEALKLSAAWGGEDRYIPGDPDPDCEICRIISLDAARVLAAAGYGGRPHYIPQVKGIGNVKAALRRAESGGLTGTAELARRVGCSSRYVRMVRNVGQSDPRQTDMFSKKGT